MPFIFIIIAVILVVKISRSNAKKKELIKFQNILLDDPVDRLFMTESRMHTLASEQAQNDLRIINDSVKIVENTEKPDVFFSRMELIEQHSKHMMALEPYVSFSVSPTDAYNEFATKKPFCIQLFLERYFAAVQRKVASLKTDTAKKRQYHNFYDSLQAYYPKMGKSHIKYIEEAYEANK